MPFRDEIDAIDDRIDAKVKPSFIEGTVISVQPRYVRVRVSGSSRSVNVYYSETSPPGVGEHAMASLSKQENKYVLQAAWQGTGSRAGLGNRKPEDFALAPPNNLAAVALPGAIIVQWDDPVAQVLAFEVQTNTSGVDAGATSFIVTRGMVSIPTPTALYARVRSVTTDFRYSSWSDWVHATPDAFSTSYAELTDVVVSGISDGDVPIWDAALGKWIPGAAGAGSFSGDAFDVPYTPTTSGDWSAAPTDVGMALDTLAADVFGLGGGGNPQPSQWVNTTSENITGTSYAAFTNSAEGTFTAPATGKVYVTVSARMSLGNTTYYGYTSWELRAGASIGSGSVITAADDNRAIRVGNTVTAGAPIYDQGSHRYLVTGLTPGDTYNIRTMHKSSITLTSEFRGLLVEPVL